MIKDNQIVEVKVEKRTLEHYSKLGEINNNRINVEAKNLYKSSKEKVIVECDICHKEKTILFSSYYNNIQNGGYYTCEKCKWRKIYSTNIKKYGVKIFNNREKTKMTNLKKYGCENVSGSQEIKDKKIQTNLKNWGVENVFQSDIIKKISKDTKKNKYKDEYFTNREKSKQTCLMNNGVEWPTQSCKVLEKRNENNLEKYGVEHYTQTDEYKDDIKKINMNKYGTEWYMSSKDFKDKSKFTNLDRYGVEYNMQNEKTYMKAQINGFKAKIHNDTKLFYRGENEKHFLDMCYDKNIEVEQGIRFSYIFNGKNRFYFSDYFLQDKNLIIEIKSSYYYKKYYEMNIEKMNSVKGKGFNFIFIIDKDYQEFDNYI
jgi:hypothetical protein